jgi:hypothetical protein
MSTAEATVDFDVPDDFGDDGQFLKEKGIYHCSVQDVMIGTGPSGKAIDGFSIQLGVLDGTVRNEQGCTQVGRTISVTLFNPKLTEKDGGKFSRKKQSKLLIAVNALDPSKKGQKVQIDLNKIRDQQLVVSFEVDDYNSKDGKTYLQVANAGMDVWHVDDPHAKDIPKNLAALKLIPVGLRHDAKWFDAMYERKTAAGNGASGLGSTTTTTNASADAGRVNLDDL